jgi:site-specific recombinase XerC
MPNRSEENDSDETREYQDWSHDLVVLQDIGEELLAEWRDQEPQSHRDYPTVRWLTDNGYSHLRWVLREKHEMGIPEFFILLTSAGGSDKERYDWSIEDVATIERAKAYLDDRVECRDWADSIKRTNRSRLDQVLRRFAEEYGDDGVVALANDPSVEPDVYHAFKEVGKTLRAELISDDSAHHHLRAAHRFLEWLDRSGRIAYDPMDGIEAEFRWDWSTEPTSLTGDQVRRLWLVAETDAERMLVIGYCVWGVRTKELPAVHVDQINLNEHDPKIKFGDRERKNGQGEVSLIYGLEALAGLLDERAQQPNWNGYLYPSDSAHRESLCAKQARLRFKTLCRRADVTIDGEPATPKHGRSFYYNILADAETDLLEAAGKLAEEQGASDPVSVREFYLTSERRRRYRRVFFRHRIRQILPDDAYAGDNTQTTIDSSLDEFN